MVVLTSRRLLFVLRNRTTAVARDTILGFTSDGVSVTLSIVNRANIMIDFREEADAMLFGATVQHLHNAPFRYIPAKQKPFNPLKWR